MIYFAIAVAAGLLSYSLTALVKHVAVRLDITDKPTVPRKLHSRPMPLMGGVALFLALSVSVGAYLIFAPSDIPQLTDFHVARQHVIGILVGALFLMIGGLLDDRFNLKPTQQIVWPLLAIGSVIVSGIGISSLSNPFGGVILLDTIKIPIITLNGVVHSFTVWSDILTAVWLLAAIYTTKFLDGLDGLVTGITGIGCAIIALVSLFLFVNIPTALLATIMVGCCVGFLFHNAHPASIFLGESGSTFCGYMLGVLAIISGAKFATALLILGFPILDAAWVILQRVFIDKKSPFVGDRKHLHFRLIDAGISHAWAVRILYGFSLLFGGSALIFQRLGKVYALGFLVCIMALFGLFIMRRIKTSKTG